jgi:Zn-dependent M16 (insulinase) family peptidase
LKKSAARPDFIATPEPGAELLSLVTDDENKVFGITFRTPPTDSTGVAHIQEHSVLCGSRKYPVKKPFVELETFEQEGWHHEMEATISSPIYKGVVFPLSWEHRPELSAKPGRAKKMVG